MWTDALGQPVTLAGGAQALEAVDAFVLGFIGSQARVVDVLRAQDDSSPYLQACCAAVHMFAETSDAPRHARPFIDRARAGTAGITARERSFIDAVGAWVDGDVPRAIALHGAYAREHPRDLAALKLGHYHLFNRGDAPGMLRLALACREAAADLPWLHGMLAFAWEQCHALERAEEAAREAMRLRHDEPWAHHALAHVMLAQGRFAEGHAFLAEVAPTWVGLNSFMLTHNWWHQALFAIELGIAGEALQLYDTRVWGVAKDYSQDQVNAVSLLARLELVGQDVGGRWADVAAHVAARGGDPVKPFLDVQYLLALGRAGHGEADALLARIVARADAGGEDDGVWRDVALPAARGVLAWARGEHATAARELGTALPRLLEIGGSHAQRDLFAQVHLDALARSGQLVGAHDVVQPLVQRWPQSRRLRARAEALRASLGLADVGDFR